MLEINMGQYGELSKTNSMFRNLMMALFTFQLPTAMQVNFFVFTTLKCCCVCLSGEP